MDFIKDFIQLCLAFGIWGLELIFFIIICFACCADGTI